MHWFPVWLDVCNVNPYFQVLNSEKSKPKTGARPGEMNVGTKTVQQQPSSLQNVNQYLRSGNVKSDTPKTSHGKYLVLKPVWENGVTPPSKDVTSPTNSSTSRAANTQLAVAPPVVSAPSRSPNSQKVSSLERKVSALDLKSGSTLEKRPSLSQVQSRNDFFNLIKKKTSVNPSATLPESGTNISSPTSEKSGEGNREVCSAPASPHPVGAEVNGNGENCKEIQRFSDNGEDECPPSSDIYLDEEEAKFLRSLGWDENAGEDEGLTEEEINAFYEEVNNFFTPFVSCRVRLQNDFYCTYHMSLSVILFTVPENEAIIETMPRFAAKAFDAV